MLHILSLCVSSSCRAVRVFIGCVPSCYILCCVARSLCISLAACFHVVMSCVNTWLMSFSLAACSCPVLHMAGLSLLVVSFLCAMCSHVNLS